jgi:hypothetical protein
MLPVTIAPALVAVKHLNWPISTTYAGGILAPAQ